MKAALNAPSPKRRRKRFGILKATTKASQARLVPKKLAHIISLASPKILLSSVQRLTVFADFKKLFFSCIYKLAPLGPFRTIRPNLVQSDRQLI